MYRRDEELMTDFNRELLLFPDKNDGEQGSK
jgi:hypothetical protein